MPLYQLLLRLFATAVLLPLWWRGDRNMRHARLGRTTPTKRGPHIWVHGASNGELASAKPVIDALNAALPEMRFLITANSDTGVNLARDWALPRTSVHPAPLDLPGANAQMIDAWQVAAHITLESELWPNRLVRLNDLGIPVIVLGARLTEGTAKFWRLLSKTARRALNAVDFLSPQDQTSAERLLELGLQQAVLRPVLNLKSLYAPDPTLVPNDELVEHFAAENTLLAASTHPPEEEIVIKAWSKARETEPDLKLILAPRHARRGDEVADLLAARGIAFDRRSSGRLTQAPVLLADTMGEMPIWYALANRVFVGGSLSDRGGHTPFEPAHFGAAILCGPDVSNFADAYAKLRDADAVWQVADAKSLASAVSALADPQAQSGAAARATAALEHTGGLDPLVTEISALVDRRANTTA